MIPYLQPTSPASNMDKFAMYGNLAMQSDNPSKPQYIQGPSHNKYKSLNLKSDDPTVFNFGFPSNTPTANRGYPSLQTTIDSNLLSPKRSSNSISNLNNIMTPINSGSITPSHGVSNLQSPTRISMGGYAKTLLPQINENTPTNLPLLRQASIVSPKMESKTYSNLDHEIEELQKKLRIKELKSKLEEKETPKKKKRNKSNKFNFEKMISKMMDEESSDEGSVHSTDRSREPTSEQQEMLKLRPTKSISITNNLLHSNTPINPLPQIPEKTLQTYSINQGNNPTQHHRRNIATIVARSYQDLDHGNQSPLNSPNRPLMMQPNMIQQQQMMAQHHLMAQQQQQRQQQQMMMQQQMMQQQMMQQPKPMIHINPNQMLQPLPINNNPKMIPMSNNHTPRNLYLQPMSTGQPSLNSLNSIDSNNSSPTKSPQKRNFKPPLRSNQEGTTPKSNESHKNNETTERSNNLTKINEEKYHKEDKHYKDDGKYHKEEKFRKESPIVNEDKLKEDSKPLPLFEQKKKKVTLRLIGRWTPKAQLRIHCWAMMYTFLLKNATKKLVLRKRQKTMVELPKKIDMMMEEYIKAFIDEETSEEIFKMLSAKNYDYAFVKKIKDKKENEKEDKEKEKDLSTDPRISYDPFLKQSQVILHKIIANTKRLPDAFFRMLSTLIEDGAHLPNNYFSQFELSRLPFSAFGALKGVAEWNSKILIGGLVIVRMFLIGIIMKHIAVIPYVKENNEVAMVLGSVLYQCTMDHLRSLAGINFKNDKTVISGMKVTPVPKLATPLSEFEMAKFPVKRTKTVAVTDIIDGFYLKEQMPYLFKEKLKGVESLKSLIAGWIETIYEKTHAVWVADQKRKEERLERQNKRRDDEFVFK